MPVKFSESERQTINSQLMMVGKQFFEDLGFKKTSIDLIVNRVGIAKGSFYKFFDNKESLYYSILLEMERNLHEESLVYLAKQSNFIDAYKTIISKQINLIQNEPLLKQSVDSTIMFNIWLKLSDEMKSDGEAFDVKKMKDINTIAKKKAILFLYDLETTSGILRSLVFMLLHPEVMASSYTEVTKFHIDSTINNLFKEV